MNPATTRGIKIIILTLLGAALSFLTFYFLNRFLIGTSFTDLWVAIFFAWAFLVLVALQIVFIGNLKNLLGIILVQGLSPIIALSPYLFPEPSYFVIAGILAFTILALWGASRGFRNLENSLKVHFFSSVHRALPKIIVGLLLLTTVVFYFYFFQLDNLSNENAEKIFNRSLDSANPVLQVWFPGVTFGMNIDTAILKISEIQVKRSQLQLLKQGVNLNELTPDAKEELVVKAAERMKNSLEGIIGKIESDETLGGALCTAIRDQLVSMTGTAKLVLEISAIVLLFFSLKALAFVFYIPAEIIAFILFKILLVLGFAEIAIEEKSREIVII